VWDKAGGAGMTIGRDADVDLLDAAVVNLPQQRGALVADDRVRNCQNRRLQMTQGTNVRPADGYNACAYQVKPTARERVPDRRRRESDRVELVVAEDVVLAARNCQRCRVCAPDRYDDLERTVARNSPPT
jgi:hypothetical protein